MPKLLNTASIPTLARRFQRDERGNIAMMTALMAVMIVGVSALAIDASRGFSAKSDLANASDAVALMLAKSGEDDEADLRAQADAYLARHYPGESGARLSVVSIEKDGDVVSVQLANNIDTTLGRILKRDNLDIGAASQAVYSETEMDIALVLDTTGSMGWPATGGGTKMQALKSAANGMANEIETLASGNVRMSVVPFSDYVNVGADNANAPWLRVVGNRSDFKGCVGSRPAPRDETPAFGTARIPGLSGIECGAPVQGLTTNFNSVRSAIDSLEPRGFTYMPAGLAWGWRSLQSNAQPLTAEVRRSEKVIVMMTDGSNTRSKNGLRHDRRDNGRDADRKTQALCSAIKDDNITVYTIAYEVSDNATRNLLEGCATSSNNFFNARDAGDLNDAFREIGASLNQLRISA